MNQKVCVRTIVFVLENTPNERIRMTTILRYCEVTGLPRKASMENGHVISVCSSREGKSIQAGRFSQEYSSLRNIKF